MRRKDGRALGRGKRKSRIEYQKRSGIALFIRSDNETGYDAVLAVVSNTVQAGLLTPGSSYWLRLPDLLVSDIGAAFVPGHSGGPVPDSHGVPSCVLANT